MSARMRGVLTIVATSCAIATATVVVAACGGGGEFAFWERRANPT